MPIQWHGQGQFWLAAFKQKKELTIFAHTLGSAHALLMEDDIGSITVGKSADFIVLDRNLLEIPKDDISETQVVSTVFNGEVVYEK